MKTEIFQFHNDKLPVIINDAGEIYVAIKPICEAIGLHADSAVNGIRKDEILGDVHGIYSVRDAIGRQNDMLCLPIQHVHGWLFRLQTAKVKPEARQNLLRYQRECYQALYNHFFGKQKEINTLLGEQLGIEDDLKIARQKVKQLETDLTRVHSKIRSAVILTIDFSSRQNLIEAGV